MAQLSYDHTTTYFRDGFVPFAEANLSIASSPVLYGLSTYTVFSANWNPKSEELYCFRLREHHTRLVQASRILDFDPFDKHYSFERFQELVLELLHINEVREDALIRATIFIDELMAGTRINGLHNAFSMYVYPMGEILPRSGIHACVSSWQRLADSMIPSRAKVNGSYVNSSLMKNEALRNGYDEAIALDAQGHVTEGTVANLFIVRDGVLITPHVAGDILEGITRRSVLDMAAQLGLPCQERAVDRSELYIADEVFMSGGSARITPILSVDKRPVGDGKPGPLTRKLSQLYYDIQTGQPRAPFPEWRTPVYSVS